jgi:hypothetical protein
MKKIISKIVLWALNGLDIRVGYIERRNQLMSKHIDNLLGIIEKTKIHRTTDSLLGVECGVASFFDAELCNEKVSRLEREVREIIIAVKKIQRQIKPPAPAQAPTKTKSVSVAKAKK